MKIKIVDYPIVTSHRICEKCGKEMRFHGWIEETEETICNYLSILCKEATEEFSNRYHYGRNTKPEDE